MFCGGNGVCEKTKWGVYTPLTEDCTNVQCEPGLICCENHPNKICALNTCHNRVNSPGCTNPKGGSQQDTQSSCSDLGLYDCNYSLPCEATTPFVTTGPTSVCNSKRQGNTCTFPLSGTCDPNAGAGVHENPPSTAGTCYIRGQVAGSCTVPSASSFCDQGHWQTQTYNCHCSTTCTGNPPVCNQTCSTCTRQVWVCDDYDYTLSSSSCNKTFSGACGVPSGGCSCKR